MARILEEIPRVEKRTVCKGGCGMTIAYVPNDLTRRYGSSCGENETYIGLVCPNSTCKQFIILETR